MTRISLVAHPLEPHAVSTGGLHGSVVVAHDEAFNLFRVLGRLLPHGEEVELHLRQAEKYRARRTKAGAKSVRNEPLANPPHFIPVNLIALAKLYAEHKITAGDYELALGEMLNTRVHDEMLEDIHGERNRRVEELDALAGAELRAIKADKLPGLRAHQLATDVLAQGVVVRFAKELGVQLHEERVKRNVRGVFVPTQEKWNKLFETLLRKRMKKLPSGIRTAIFQPLYATRPRTK
ncbi:MAG: hypothetical protein AABW54_02290 [Candidatus Micrarchaeota archaeon]